MIPLKSTNWKTLVSWYIFTCSTLLAVGLLSCASAYCSGEAPSDKKKPEWEESLANGFRASATPLLKYFQSKDYENVGVLKFLIKVGDRDASFHVGRLNDLLTTRLENLLIVFNDQKDPIGITRNASIAAAERGAKGNIKPSYVEGKDRTKLFEFDYPLAWGGKSAKVDAFVTGIVLLNVHAKPRTIKVVLFTFDKKNPAKLHPLRSFQTRLDRNSLAEAGIGFTVSKRALNAAQTIADVDNAAEVQLGTGEIAPIKEDFEDVLDFQILYDNKPVRPQQRKEDGSFYCPAPKKGQTVHFALESKERIGLVLFVNGVNTLMMEKYSEARRLHTYARWILEPKEKYVIEGFYPDFKNVQEFKVGSESEANLGDLGPTQTRGRIEMHIFREAPEIAKMQNAGDTMDLGGIPDPNDSYADVRNKLFAKVAEDAVNRKLLLPGDDKKGTNVAEVEFSGALSLHRTITYYQDGEESAVVGPGGSGQ